MQQNKITINSIQSNLIVNIKHNNFVKNVLFYNGKNVNKVRNILEAP